MSILDRRGGADLLRKLTSSMNVGLRASSMVLRFALVLVMARDLGLEAVGLYGLAQSIVLPTPAVLGFGIDFFLSRDLVHEPLDRAIIALRDRIILSLSYGVPIGLLAFLACAVVYSQELVFCALVIALGILEPVGYSLHVGLIALSRPVAANILFAFRSSAWIPIIFVIHFVLQKNVGVNLVLVFWVTFTIIGLVAVLIWGLRSIGFRLLVAKADLKRFILRASKGWYVTIHDVSNAMIVSLDRYVIAGLLGLREVGAYSFYLSFANAAFTLVYTGFVQTETPKLVRARSDSDHRRWAEETRRFQVRVAKASIAFSLMCLVGVCGAAYAVKGGDLIPFLWLAPCLGLTQFILLQSSARAAILYSAHDDMFISFVNIAMLLVYIGLLPFAAMQFGLPGVVSLLGLNAMCLLVARSLRVGGFVRKAE